MTITAIRNTQYVAKDGSSQIVIRIAIGKERRLYKTGYSATENQWIEDEGMASRKHPDQLLVNDRIDEMVGKAKEYAANVRRAGKPFNFNAVFDDQKVDGCFTKYIDTLLAEMEKEKKVDHASRIRVAKNAMTEAAEQDDVNYTDINAKFIKKLETILVDREILPQTINDYMQYLNYCWEKAIKWDSAPKENPFDLYEAKDEVESEREWLDRDELLKMQNYRPTANGSKGLNRREAADMYITSYYIRGIRFVNVQFIKKTDIKGDILHFRNAKNGKLATARINSVVKEIFERNSRRHPRSEFVFCESTPEGLTPQQWLNYKNNKNARVNRNLRRVLNDLKIYKNITFHCARHTFANNLLRSGASLKEIQGALIHGQASTTEKYLEGFSENHVQDVMDNLYRMTDSDLLKQDAA